MRRYILRLLGITDLGSNQDQQRELYARLASVEAKANYLNREHLTTLRRLAAIDGAMTERKQKPAEQARQIELSIGGKQTAPEPVDDVKGVLLSYGGPRKRYRIKQVKSSDVMDFYTRALGGYGIMSKVVERPGWYSVHSDGEGRYVIKIKNATGKSDWYTRSKYFATKDEATKAFGELLAIHHMQTTDPYTIWLRPEHRYTVAQ